MATLETIAAAIKEIDNKKENLKKAYDGLQSHSPLLSSFSLSWADLDAHFTNTHNYLVNRFRLLQSLHCHSQPKPPQDPSSLDPHSPSLPLQDPSSSSQPPTRPGLALNTQLESQPQPSGEQKDQDQDRRDSVVARPELRALCEKMDGKGLRKFIGESSKDRESIRVELPGAIRVAVDPGLMVLVALHGFYGEDGVKHQALGGVRRACLLLLEVLMGMDVNIGKEVRERAKILAFEWKEKLKLVGDNNLEVLGFLHLVAAYGLGCEFEKDDLVEFLVIVARTRQGTLLCKAIDLGDKVQEIIQKLIDGGKQLLAVKYIFELELIDKYPPVPLLRAYLKESKQLAKKVCKDGKNSFRSQNDSAARELSALKAVIKVIEDYKLESEYPKETLQKRVEQLERVKASRKRPAAASASAPTKAQRQQKRKLQQSGNKCPRTTASVGHPQPSVAGANITVPRFQQPYVRAAGLLPENSAAYLGSQAGPYGLVGSSPAASSVGMCGFTGPPVGFPGSSNHATSHLYLTESHIPSGYYDRSTPYGGYGLPPQYHPAYYPQ